MNLDEIKKLIIDVPDFPKQGIIFKDITPLLANSDAFNSLIQHFAKLTPKEVTHLLAIESRGFILGSALAHNLSIPLILARKPGKLPRNTIKVEYQLEYGCDSLEIHGDSIPPNSKVVIIDDVLATGGTASAAEELVLKSDAQVLTHLFLMEIEFLKGKDKLKNSHQSIYKI